MFSLRRTYLVLSWYFGLSELLWVVSSIILLCLSGGRGTTSPFTNNSAATFHQKHINQWVDEVINKLWLFFLCDQWRTSTSVIFVLWINIRVRKNEENTRNSWNSQESITINTSSCVFKQREITFEFVWCLLIDLTAKTEIPLARDIVDLPLGFFLTDKQ